MRDGAARRHPQADQLVGPRPLFGCDALLCISAIQTSCCASATAPPTSGLDYRETASNDFVPGNGDVENALVRHLRLVDHLRAHGYRRGRSGATPPCATLLDGTRFPPNYADVLTDAPLGTWSRVRRVGRCGVADVVPPQSSFHCGGLGEHGSATGSPRSANCHSGRTAVTSCSGRRFSTTCGGQRPGRGRVR